MGNQGQWLRGKNTKRLPCSVRCSDREGFGGRSSDILLRYHRSPCSPCCVPQCHCWGNAYRSIAGQRRCTLKPDMNICILQSLFPSSWHSFLRKIQLRQLPSPHNTTFWWNFDRNVLPPTAIGFPTCASLHGVCTRGTRHWAHHPQIKDGAQKANSGPVPESATLRSQFQ